MITTNELRVGNKLLFQRNSEIIEIITVAWVSDDSIGYKEEHEASYPKSPNHFFGIPLTPEWLERCGFKYLDSIISGRYFVQWADSNSEIAWYPVGQFISINTATGGEGEQSNYTEVSMKHIQYLHQLQNLYFALTGQELQIKKP